MFALLLTQEWLCGEFLCEMTAFLDSWFVAQKRWPKE
jgi:hypothetical protein